MNKSSRRFGSKVCGFVAVTGYACSNPSAEVPGSGPMPSDAVAPASVNMNPVATTGVVDPIAVSEVPADSTTVGPRATTNSGDFDTPRSSADMSHEGRGRSSVEGSDVTSHNDVSDRATVDLVTSGIVEVADDCMSSTTFDAAASGTGPHGVVIETNAGVGISEGTIFRPADLGGPERYPIFVWGQGACSKNGLANAAAMAEIASHGYFVVADGTPNGQGNREMNRADLAAMGAPLIAYVDWATAENAKTCSAYYQSIDTTKVAANGFSCGGLMAQGTVLDERIVTWGVTSSGMAGASEDFYAAIHTPVLFVEGGTGDVAYDGALEGYNRISAAGVPVMWFDKALGHGGDLLQRDGGDFTRINLAWLNWWLKDDESSSGKGRLVGDDCMYCVDNAWDVRSSSIR